MRVARFTGSHTTIANSLLQGGEGGGGVQTKSIAVTVVAKGNRSMIQVDLLSLIVLYQTITEAS